MRIMKNLIDVLIEGNATKVSVKELYDLLVVITRSMFGSVVYCVNDTRSMTKNKVVTIKKLVRVSNISINHDYTKKINNYLAKAVLDGLITKAEIIEKLGSEEFVAKPMNGKTRISTTIVESDKTKLMNLDAKVLKSNYAEILGFYVAEQKASDIVKLGKKAPYIFSDELLTESETLKFELWKDSYFNPTPKKTSGRGILPKELDFRMITLGLHNIREITFNSKQYELAE